MPAAGFRKYPLLILLAVLLLGLLWLGKTTERGSEVPAGFDRSPTHLVYSHHARCRMACRHIDESEVKEVLKDGRINYAKSEPEEQPDPKFALEGITHDGQNVRVVIAVDRNRKVVVTVIDLGREWPCHCPG